MPEHFATIVIPQNGMRELTVQAIQDIRRHESCPILVLVNDKSATPTFRGASVIYTRQSLTESWNNGIRAVRTSSVILLNNDIRCEGPFVERLCMSYGSITGAQKRNDRDLGRVVLQGWCLCFPVQLWEEIGQFNEAMSLYFSDTEFQSRALAAGGTLNAVDVPLRHLKHKTAHNAKIVPNRGKRFTADRRAFLKAIGKR